MIGFNGDAHDSKDVYDTFINNPGYFGVGNIVATGVLKEINFKERYILVQPSLIGIGETSTGKQIVRLDYETPTLISIPDGAPISMRPLQEGDLEKMSTEGNQGKPAEPIVSEYSANCGL
jgi:hypothetical protein